MTNTPLQTYFQAIEKLLKAGIATEHSYRPALKDLLENLTTGITATNEPKRVKCGAPDYVIERTGLTIGYIEAKDVDVSLDKIEKDEQLGRYRRALSNLVLTDYLEFRWYVQGEGGLAEKKMSARLATTKPGGKLVFDKEGAAKVSELLTSFLEHEAVEITKPEDLAKRMARLAHMIRDVIVQAFKENEASRTMRGQLVAFDKTLLPNITEEQFADMFAQTIAYGLFAARYNHTSKRPFTRYDATREIPKTNPFLRDLFALINGLALDDEPFIGFVDELAQVLDTTRMDEVLAKFGKRTRQEDPIIHFYETFLSQYDPKLRELRGVYYTPTPVISYMVRSVDYLLKEEFGIEEGLADEETIDYSYLDADGQKHTDKVPRVLILDPACGTGTFLSSIVEHIRDSYRASNSSGMWSAYVGESLLPRLFGFELLMAPYAMAHLRLGMQLEGLDLPPEQRSPWKYDFAKDERLGIYLTNSLSEGLEKIETLQIAHFISDEANEAASVKRLSPVMVVIGNPPYSGHSANKDKWISDLLHGKEKGNEKKSSNYFEVDGQPLRERNPKWLNDDYVKFIRFAQWRIEKTGYGILAFITNHGYLDNPTFRGMRQSLMQTFDDIYVLNLHGNSKKKERSPDGSKDENVFDIQQGVAIGIFVKRKGSVSGTKVVHHADLWGERERFQDKREEKRLVAGKYYWLTDNDLKTTDWRTFEPQTPFYLFVPQSRILQAEYEQGKKITDIMPTNVLGFQTHRDQFAIDFDEQSLRRRITDMRDPHLSDQEFAEKYGFNTFNGSLTRSRQKLRQDTGWQKHFIQCLYRPFDKRFCYFSEAVIDRPRKELIEHVVAHKNLCLLTARQQATLGFRHVFVAQEVANDCVVSTTSREANQVFPLYLYTGKNELMGISEGQRRPNFADDFTSELATKLTLQFISDGTDDLQTTFGPEDIFHYMYAIFHAPTYRERYAEFLKIDFPRLPLTSNVELFRALCAHGKRLVELHLLEKVSRGTIGFQGQGDYTVEKVEYIPKANQSETGCIWINKTQYFEDVPAQVWEFHIGGYQVCHKWLKDRKGRTLALTDLREYQKIVSALSETITLMEKIDETIEEHGGWPIE
jgi:predicted helicase